jgi:predicted homoserine dehydrogenase-like protein
VLRVGLRGEPTGTPRHWKAGVATVAKRALRTGELLDGEGGYLVYGALTPVAADSDAGPLPIGLAHGVRLSSDVPAGAVVRWRDVAIDESNRLARQVRAASQRWWDASHRPTGATAPAG